MSACSAFGCTNRGSKKIPGITFHKFPKDPKRREEWVKAVSRKDWTPSNHSVLCSTHFAPESLDRTSVTCVRVRENDVPSIFQAFPSDIQRDVVEKYKDSDNSTCIPQWNSVRNSLCRIRYMANEQKEADLEKKAEKDNREMDESLFEPEITIKEEVLDEPEITITSVTGSAGATSWSDETVSNRPLKMPQVMCTACPTNSTMTYTTALPTQSSLSQLSSLVTRTNPYASYSEYPVFSNRLPTPSTFRNQTHVMNVQLPVITQVVGSEETITSLPEKRDDSSGDQPKDQFDAYGEYIASKLRQLDWKSCACVQKAIGDLLFEAEMGKFKN